MIVARDSHRKTESDDEGEKRENGRLQGIEVFPLIFADGAAPPTEEVADICRKPLGDKRYYEDDKRAVENAAYANGLVVALFRSIQERSPVHHARTHIR